MSRVGATGSRSAAPVMRVRRVPGAPVVSVRLWLWGGIRHEELPGLGLITGRMLTEGSRRRDFRRIARDAEDRGMLVQSYASADALGLSIDALSSDWPLALDWLAELILEPAFPEERVRWLCRQSAAELESLLDQPDFRASAAFLDQLYHPHPYGRPAQGDVETLARIGAEDCHRYHRRTLSWGGCAVVAGDVDEDAVRNRLEELFVGWPAPDELPSVPPPEGRQGARREVALPPGEQAQLCAGHLTLDRGEPDLPALDVLSIALGAGGGLSGRLPARIRDNEGLAYHVDVSLTAGAGRDPGRFSVQLGTAPATVAAAERAIREELDRLLADGLEPEEVADAKSYVLGRDPFRRETARQWADLIAEALLYELPVDDPEWIRQVVEALDADSMLAAARRWLDPKALRVTVGLPAAHSPT